MYWSCLLWKSSSSELLTLVIPKSKERGWLPFCVQQEYMQHTNICWRYFRPRVWAWPSSSQEHNFISFPMDALTLENSLMLNRLTGKRFINQNANLFTYMEQYPEQCNKILASAGKCILLPSTKVFLGNQNKIRCFLWWVKRRNKGNWMILGSAVFD